MKVTGGGEGGTGTGLLGGEVPGGTRQEASGGNWEAPGRGTGTRGGHQDGGEGSGQGGPGWDTGAGAGPLAHGVGRRPSRSIGENIQLLVERPDGTYCFRLHRDRVYYVR